MISLLRSLRDTFLSLKLTLALLGFGMVLIFAATLDQVNLGIWAVQEKYFRSFIVYLKAGPFVVPAFPGGYLIGGLLLLNLTAAFLHRFVFSWRKAGIIATHAGLILLLVGELLTGLWQEDYHMRLDEGQTKNYAESFRENELVLIDTTDPKHDNVVSITEAALARKQPIQHPGLPFRVVATTFYPNSIIEPRHTSGSARSDMMPRATAGIGQQLVAVPQPITHNPDERNVPTAYVELATSEGSLGRWMVSLLLAAPQTFEHGGRQWMIALRSKRNYQPFSLTLLKFSHDRYAGTQIPKNFSSRLRLLTPDGQDDREVLIYMNNPLRHGGLTFYQAGFENNDRTSVLQVVRNPSWLFPYVACTLMGLGLLYQFSFHLVGFSRRRRTAAPVAVGGVLSPHGQPESNADARGTRELLPPSPAHESKLLRNGLAAVITGVALLTVANSLRAPRNPGAFDLAGFSRLPTLVNGRVKPLDTVARTSLLMMQGRQSVVTPDGRRLSPAEWLLDLLYRPTLADTYATFEIVHPDVLALLQLTTDDGAGGKRFALQQFSPRLAEIERQSKLADGIAASARSPFQRAIVQLRDSLLLYQHLQASLVAPGDSAFLERLARFETIKPSPGPDGHPAATGARPSAADATLVLELARAFAVMDSVGYLNLIPPAAVTPDNTGWKTAGAAWTESFGAPAAAPAARAYLTLGQAWTSGQPEVFNQTVTALHQDLNRGFMDAMRKSRVETRFNSAQPFYTSTILYVAAFLVALLSWLKWPEALGRSAFALVLIAFVISTVGIGTRMWLEARPPVTNLYSSALFVGWGAVALCLFLEYFFRNAIGSAAAGLIGFATLLIAHHLALSGDTLEMMRAVLDSNFWLATHVVTITVGYSATLLAGLLAIFYVLRGLFTRSLDAVTADGITRMIYGIVCFATLFSLVGTVLGGIWADQSWGRFWGWDPKENGALLIVIWNAMILHARMSGLIRQRGLAVMAIFGNVVTAWSWFGVNMLGVGLHSYGFMGAAFWWLIIFASSQLSVMAMAAWPLARWRSFRSPSTRTETAVSPAALRPATQQQA
jgi:ABC-type transport system involved in cytochrome c biogenesis permease subunit